MELKGQETATLELRGALALADARAKVPATLELEEVDGRAVVGLLLFQMKGLKAVGVPGPSFDYAEALWRVGVVVAGRPAWFAVACDLDHGLVRTLGRWMIRYPTRAASVDWAAGDPVTVTVLGNGAALRVSAWSKEGEVAAVPPRRALVGSASALYEVPWNEEPAPWRRAAAVEVIDDALTVATLGVVRWSRDGLLHRGRIHRCGFARRL